MQSFDTGGDIPTMQEQHGDRANLGGQPLENGSLVSSPLRLVAEGVDVRFSGLHALDSVDFELAIGEIVGLIGPNGSGKTTLLNALSGVVAPTGGHLRIGSRDVTSLAAHEIARLGVSRTFQNIRLFDNMTVLQNVQIGAALDPQGARGARLHSAAMMVLGELGLEGHSERRAGTLPYGIRRRIELARALAAKPRFLLLDEPAAGANETESEELSALIEQIAESYRLGILVIEHDLRLVMRIAHRIVVLNEGRVIATGDAHEISRHPAVREAYFGKRWVEEQTQRSTIDTTETDDKKERP